MARLLWATANSGESFNAFSQKTKASPIFGSSTSSGDAKNLTNGISRDIYGEKTISASIFMDYRNNTDVLDDNTIIYGHNLNTTMFNDLDFFVDEETRDEFYKANGIFRFDTVYKYMQWEVYSAYVVDKDDFNYLITNFSDVSSHRAFLDETLERSAVDWNISVTTSDTILTLSTCNHWFNNSRTVVHARLITP